MPLVYDGFVGQGRGMNGALSPILLQPDQFSRGVNIDIRGNLVKTRPAFIQESLTGMPSGLLQGAGTWSLQSGDRIVFVVAGTVYVLYLDALVIITVGALLDTNAQCFLTPTDRYMVIQDGSSSPVILEDVSGVTQLATSFEESETWSVSPGQTTITLLYAADSVTTVTFTPTGGAEIGLSSSEYSVSGVTLTLNPAVPEAGQVTVTYQTLPSIPIGYMGIYAHGRLHLVPKYQQNTVPAVDGRDSILSGDVKLPSDPTTVLRFVETEYLNGGGAHSMPQEMGFIGGLGVYRNAPTGTGNGEVIAFGRHGVCGFDFSASREISWDEVSISRVLFFGSGSKSPWSLVNVNDDLVYRGLDGLRILRYVITQTAGSSGGMSNLPMSLEVDQYLRNDAAYLPLVSTSLADNRLYCTCSGTGSNYFKGLICWDLATAYYNGTSSTGAYNGVWTGDNFARTLSALRAGVPTAYVFAQGPILYRIDTSATADYSVSAGTVPIESQLETKAFQFGDSTNPKQLHSVELWVSALVRDTTFELFYRPHGYPLWKELASTELLVGDGSLPQIRRKLGFTVDFSPGNCDTSTGEPLYVATEFQICVRWTGFAKIERFRITAEAQGDPAMDVCPETEAVVLAAGASTGETISSFTYSIRGL